MKLSNVAAQLYTVRNFCKTPADIAQTLHKVRKIGYEAVQVSGVGPIAEKDLKKILDGEGLVCCATHEPGDTILNDPQKVTDRLNLLGCAYTAYPHPGKTPLDTMEQVLQLAKRLDTAGRALRAGGKFLTYHNHNVEFRQVGGRTILELLYENTSRENLQGELDTYWVQAGGGDPVAWCKRLAGRLPLLHLKDFGVGEPAQPVFKEVGHGNLGWKEIIAAAESSGCQWFIVEQDSNWEKGDPFESLRMSFEYLKGHFCNAAGA